MFLRRSARRIVLFWMPSSPIRLRTTTSRTPSKDCRRSSDSIFVTCLLIVAPSGAKPFILCSRSQISKPHWHDFRSCESAPRACLRHSSPPGPCPPRGPRVRRPGSAPRAHRCAQRDRPHVLPLHRRGLDRAYVVDERLDVLAQLVLGKAELADQGVHDPTGVGA